VALDSEEVNRLRTSLKSSSQPASRTEVAAFKARLKALSLPGLKKQLDDRVIGRKWKRDLANAEIDRRTAKAGAVADVTAVITARKRTVGLWSWVIAGVLVAISVAAMGYAALKMAGT
jgi:hypothetical protein